MGGVEIHDMNPRGILSFDLKDLFVCIAEDGLHRTWTCHDVECTGEATEDLERLAETREIVSGQTLLELSQRTNQVIWGEFCGRRPGELEDSLVIKAIDSALWEVFGDDECLDKIRSGFSDVRPARETNP